jgi:hypothetical protein
LSHKPFELWIIVNPDAIRLSSPQNRLSSPQNRPLVFLKDVTFPMMRDGRGELAMMSMIIEAIVVAFCIGGALGALAAMQLQNNAKQVEVRVQRQRYPK